jgi:drug/metabolite transporter (DMT)-like permease
MLHKSVLKGGSKAGSMLLAGTLFGPVLGNTLAMLAVKHLAAPVAQTIFSLVPIMAIPLSAIFNKEKISLNMVWPALIAFLGVVILVIS